MLWLRIIIIGTLALLSLGATAEEKEKCGPYDGVDLTEDPEMLARILSDHQKWLADTERSMRIVNPQSTNLCGADFSNVDIDVGGMRLDFDLSGAKLNRARLHGADLSGANLSGADLYEADLGGATLLGTNLSDAFLREADLSGANLSGANLNNARLGGANLTDAFLVGANLQGANLSHANLGGASLELANLIMTKLQNAILKEANLRKSLLMVTNLSNANLSRAVLSEADLRKADLSGAVLGEADLSEADLSEAILIRTDLKNARFTRAKLSGAQYEPTSAPSKGYLTRIEGLGEVEFDDGEQAGLVLLRTALKEAGLRNLERETTYAIERGKTSYAPPLERWLKSILFEWTSGYGLDYGRPLLILLSLLFPFAAVYYFPLAGRGTSRIYLVWSAERIEDDKPVGNPERRVEPLVIDSKKDHLRIIGFALYFSLLSAVHIGWRDVNVGNWIARIQPREYTLRAKGWVRTVSGIQSLISIYLLALWVLVYFGRPFG